VISAAHCLTVLLPHEALLYIGSHDIRDMSETDFLKRSAQQLIIHPDFHQQYESFSSDADIGLVILSKPVNYTKFIKPICLWPADLTNQNIIKQKGVVAGWGFNNSDQGTAIPNFVEMPVVSELTCLREDYSYYAFTSNRTLCVGEKNGKGPCHGDSGSGFVMKLDGKWTLRGIVSAGLPNPLLNTCDLSKYVVLSDAVKFMDWILMYLNN
jgi:secreted trypsin-like serine protease